MTTIRDLITSYNDYSKTIFQITEFKRERRREGTIVGVFDYSLVDKYSFLNKDDLLRNLDERVLNSKVNSFQFQETKNNLYLMITFYS